jgi:cytochrome P450
MLLHIICASSLRSFRAISQDERVYKNPEDFRPERYLSKIAGGDNEPFCNAVFGYGRR